MPKTPDRFPGDREEDLVKLSTNADALSIPGEFKFDGADFVFRDSLGDFNPRDGGPGGSGITAEQHKALRQLVHFMNDGPGDGFGANPLKRYNIGGLFTTSWYWEDSSNNKIYERIITRTGGGATVLKPTPVKHKIYDGAGNDPSNVLFTATDTITYSGIVPTLLSRSIVVGDA